MNPHPLSGDHELIIRQKPLHAKVFIGKEKGMPNQTKDPRHISNSVSDRKPIDPPPIVQLKISESVDPSQNFLQSKTIDVSNDKFLF